MYALKSMVAMQRTHKMLLVVMQSRHGWVDDGYCDVINTACSLLLQILSMKQGGFSLVDNGLLELISSFSLD